MLRIMKKKLGPLHGNRGVTMMETLVAFVVLLVVLAALYGMIRLSSELRMRATDTASVGEAFDRLIYKKSIDQSDSIQAYYYFGKSKEDLTMFSLKVNMDDGKTSVDKNLDIKGGSSHDFTGAIRVPNLDAVGYVSTDSKIEEENLVTPKAVVFSYHTGAQ